MSDQPADPELGLPGDARALLEAVVAISSDLDLHSVLNRIVESACRITQARYGALGVLDAGGHGLSDFVTHGLTEAEHTAIGELPRGQGILGLLIERPEPVHSSSPPAMSTIGRWKRSTSRDATIPITPRCHSSPAST